MLQIGYEKSINNEELLTFFQRHELIASKQYNYAGLDFFEVDTKMVLETGLCCWGGIDEWFNINASLKNFPLSHERYKNLQRSKRLFLQDISYWMILVSEFVNKFGLVALRRYYPDMDDIDNGVKQIKLDKFNEEILLNIYPNQTWIIEL